VTFLDFIGMVSASTIVLAGSAARSLPLYAAGFIVLFILTGIANGSTYKMIPAICRGKARWPPRPTAATGAPSSCAPGGSPVPRSASSARSARSVEC
jgi:nitrate/nitrite transporter NarK